MINGQKEEYEFKDLLENKLISSNLDITKVQLSKSYEKHDNNNEFSQLIGMIHFSEEEVYFELNQLFNEYNYHRDFAIEHFIHYLTDWKKCGEKIKEIWGMILN